MRFTLVLIAALVVALPVAAFEEINTPTLSDVALRGYDAVAYHTEGRAVPGDKMHVAVWKDAEWRFASAANMALFESDPERYAPQYGGYCSNQMSLGNLSDIDPQVWRIIDGKLYLFGHDAGRIRWQTETSAKIEAADGYWKTFLAE